MTADLDFCCLGLLGREGSGTEEASAGIWRLAEGFNIEDFGIESFSLRVLEFLDEVDGVGWCDRWTLFRDFGKSLFHRFGLRGGHFSWLKGLFSKMGF